MTSPHDPMQETTYPTLGEQARTLMASSASGALATLDPREGYPYNSIVEFMPLPNGDALFLLSTLAAHTTNISIDARASLLVHASAEAGELLASARLTLMGRIAIEEELTEDVRAAWLMRHPGSARYIDFADFSFYRLAVERARFIAGFGRMGWLTVEDYRAAEVDPLVDSARGIIEHMNEDHAYNLLDYARAFASLSWAQEVRMTGVDRLGFDILAQGAAEGERERARLMFSRECTESAHVRRELVAMVKNARELQSDDDQSI